MQGRPYFSSRTQRNRIETLITSVEAATLQISYPQNGLLHCPLPTRAQSAEEHPRILWTAYYGTTFFPCEQLEGGFPDFDLPCMPLLGLIIITKDDQQQLSATVTTKHKSEQYFERTRRKTTSDPIPFLALENINFLHSIFNSRLSLRHHPLGAYDLVNYFCISLFLGRRSILNFVVVSCLYRETPKPILLLLLLVLLLLLLVLLLQITTTRT